MIVGPMTMKTHEYSYGSWSSMTSSIRGHGGWPALKAWEFLIFLIFFFL
jgi:hypothetical protein